MEFPNGDIVQLTDADDVHGYSGVISKDGTELFYTQGDTIKAIHLETFEERVLAEFPGGGLGECSVSADEKFIVTAMKRDDKSHITVTATDGSGGEVIYTSSESDHHPSTVPPENIPISSRIPAIRHLGCGLLNGTAQKTSRFISTTITSSSSTKPFSARWMN